MQPSVVPELALAHTATRPIHWVATATAIAGVIAASSFLQPDPATAQADSHTTTEKSAQGIADRPAPDPHAVGYPLQCGPVKALVHASATGDIDGDKHPETVSVVHCDAGSGNPPDGVYVLTTTTDAHASSRVVATLVNPKDRQTVTDLTVRNTLITATLNGYSSPDVPSCCPDQRQDVTWRWRHGVFLRSTPS